MNELAGKVALVTGAGRGIGRSVALALAGRGAMVAAVARGEEAIRSVAEEIVQAGGQSLALPVDVSRFDAMAAAVAQVEARWGPIDILVNNAAITGPIGPTAEVAPELWAEAIDVNLVGAFYVARAVLPGMIRSGWGRIINVSSGAAFGTGIPRMSSYSVSKAGMEMLTRALASELGNAGVAVVAVSPGVVDTEMQAQLRAAPVDEFGADTSRRFHGFHERGELLDPRVPADLIAALCGAAGAAHTGTSLRVSDDIAQALIKGEE
jgi:NAD(P)-dependent dehydrogenase (short-subunit alcohol dehydrogenase family)